MKRILATLLFCFVTVWSVFSSEECDESFSQAKNWKDSLTAHWNSLTEMHKMIIYCFVILFLLLILYKLIRCSIGGCGCGCGCACDQNDNGHK